MMLNVTQPAHPMGSDVKSFSVFCRDARPEDVANYGERERGRDRELLSDSDWEVTAVQREWRLLKTLLRSRFIGQTYSDLCKVVLRREPVCSGLRNLLRLVELILVLPVLVWIFSTKEFCWYRNTGGLGKDGYRTLECFVVVGSGGLMVSAAAMSQCHMG